VRVRNARFHKEALLEVNVAFDVDAGFTFDVTSTAGSPTVAHVRLAGRSEMQVEYYESINGQQVEEP
jgi:hypothetical protein